MAVRKVQGLLAAEATVRVVSPEVDDRLAALAHGGRIEWRRNTYAEGDLRDAFLVFAATDDRRAQEQICVHAAAEGRLVNVVDDPGCCNFFVPSSFRRGDLAIAVSTSGKSPAVAALVRQKLERSFGPEYAVLLEIMALVRQRLSAGKDSQAVRKKIYKKILHDDILDWIKTGRMDKVRSHLENVLEGRMTPDLSTIRLDNE